VDVFGTVQAWLAILRSAPWSEVKASLELLLYYLAVIAVFGCLFRLSTIRTIIRDFRESRGPLWDLRNTIDQLKELEPLFRDLKKQMELIDEKIDANRELVAAMQIESISGRTDDVSNQIAAAESSRATMPAPTAVPPESDDENWSLLRECWKRNTDRIEYVISQIRDGRTKLGYDRLPRTNYTRIINKLQGQGRITAAAANASRELHDLFNSYRPRNRKVPDEVAGSLAVLEQQLDRTLVPIANVLASESVADQLLPSPSPTVSTQNGRRNHSNPPNGAALPQ
jgi:hypothetical protein